MAPIVHFVAFCYIAALIMGAGCLCILCLSKERFYKLFGLEYSMLRKFLLIFFLFFLSNFLVYYNEMFMLNAWFKKAILIVFDCLLVASVYSGIKLNVLSHMELVLKLFLLTGGIYILLWGTTYVLDFSQKPVLGSILVLIADAIFSAVSSGILIICTIHQLRHNEEVWERRLLTGVNIMLIIYVCLLYCCDLFFELSHAYVSSSIAYPYFTDPIIFVFLAINGFIMVYLAVSMRHTRTRERAVRELPAGRDETALSKSPNHLYEANHISAREREVIELIAEGKNNAEIAEALCISIYTVKRHINNIFKKLEIKSRVELLSKINNS